jgi:hypothetical protein
VNVSKAFIGGDLTLAALAFGLLFGRALVGRGNGDVDRR